MFNSLNSCITFLAKMKKQYLQFIRVVNTQEYVDKVKVLIDYEKVSDNFLHSPFQSTIMQKMADPFHLNCARNHDKSYIKARPILVRHLFGDCLFRVLHVLHHHQWVCRHCRFTVFITLFLQYLFMASMMTIRLAT